MCLVAWAVGMDERFPWLLASNRDEFFNRPAAALDWWQDDGHGGTVLGGRDLGAGGAWLGLNRQGRLALVTNVREPGRFDAASPSRGALVVQALIAPTVDAGWLTKVAATPRNGFNLLVAELAADSFQWVGNRPLRHHHAAGGVWGLSNAALDTPWPKVRQLKERLVHSLPAAGSAEDLADLAFQALADRTVAADAQLPATGVPLERERQLSAAFIALPGPDATAGAVYGTRCSTVVVVERGCSTAGTGRTVHVFERSFDVHGKVALEVATRFDTVG
jgi:uncharacterized protein with NRDE domain